MKTENNKIKMNLKGVKPKIQITVPLQFEILTNPSMTNYAKVKRTEIPQKNMTDQTNHFLKTY